MVVCDTLTEGCIAFIFSHAPILIFLFGSKSNDVALDLEKCRGVAVPEALASRENLLLTP